MTLGEKFKALFRSKQKPAEVATNETQVLLLKFYIFFSLNKIRIF